VNLLAEPPLRRERLSWALFDAANSSFTLVIVTVVYVLYFKSVVVGGDAGRGDFEWGRAVSLSALLVALSSPFMGALADARAWRKQILAVYTVISIAATIALGFTGPGTVALAVVAFVIANATFEGGMAFYGSLLPSVSRPDNVGRVSGVGWATGYLGGLVCLLICFPFATSHRVDIVCWIVAAWYAAFAWPLFAFVRDRVPPVPHTAGVMARLRATLSGLRERPVLVRFFVAYFIYNDAMTTAFAFSAPLAKDALGFSTAQIIQLVLGVQVTGAAGAFFFGRMADRVGNARVVRVSLVMLIAIALSCVLCAADLDLWRQHPAARSMLFIVAGLSLGTVMGSVQAASRSFLAAVVEPEKSAEMFGLYAVAGKFSAVLGPLAFGALSLLTGGKAASVAMLAVMFAVGLALMWRVNEADCVGPAALGPGR
jgi:UMF1 family MFS transporter